MRSGASLSTLTTLPMFFRYDADTDMLYIQLAGAVSVEYGARPRRKGAHKTVHLLADAG